LELPDGPAQAETSGESPPAALIPRAHFNN
jgi:hypothetical protein